MYLITHFCIAACKSDYGKQCRSIHVSDAGELGARSGPLLFAKKKLNHKIILFSFLSHSGAWRTTHSSPMKSLNKHLNR